MQLPDLLQLLDSKALISAVSALAGGFIGNLIAVLRSRIKQLEYTATHNRVAFSANDAIFGSIEVMWQGHSVTNLFSSRIELINQTGIDLTNVKVKAYTGSETLLLGQRVEIAQTTHVPKFTDGFAQKLEVPNGQAPTAEQFEIYNHSREYLLPVFNRGQKFIATYLTTTVAGAQGPSVWLEVLHQGVRAQYRLLVPQVHGVPIKIAVSAGLVVCAALLAVASATLSEPWAAASICLVAGLFAQSIGAFAVKGLLLLKSLVLR